MIDIYTDTNEQEHDFLSNITEHQLDLLGLRIKDPIIASEEYFNKNLIDTTIDANANVSGISPNSYLTELAKPGAKLFFFKKLHEFGKKLYEDFNLDNVWDGTVYVHDATKLQPYCFGTSSTEIALYGRPYSSLVSVPPKRLDSFVHQIIEYMMDLSQENAGAIANTDFVPWIAWFVRLGKGKVKEEYVNIPYIYDHWEELSSSINEYTDKEIENLFQSLIHTLNNNFRIGGDSPFTNLSVNSHSVYRDIFAHYIFPDDVTTIENLLPIIDRVQKIIVDFMAKGRSDGLPYRFPILTANFKANEEEKNTKWFEYVEKRTPVASSI